MIQNMARAFNHMEGVKASCKSIIKIWNQNKFKISKFKVK